MGSGLGAVNVRTSDITFPPVRLSQDLIEEAFAAGATAGPINERTSDKTSSPVVLTAPLINAVFDSVPTSLAPTGGSAAGATAGPITVRTGDITSHPVRLSSRLIEEAFATAGPINERTSDTTSSPVVLTAPLINAVFASVPTSLPPTAGATAGSPDGRTVAGKKNENRMGFGPQSKWIKYGDLLSSSKVVANAIIALSQSQKHGQKWGYILKWLNPSEMKDDIFKLLGFPSDRREPDEIQQIIEYSRKITELRASGDSYGLKIMASILSCHFGDNVSDLQLLGLESQISRTDSTSTEFSRLLEVRKCILEILQLCREQLPNEKPKYTKLLYLENAFSSSSSKDSPSSSSSDILNSLIFDIKNRFFPLRLTPDRSIDVEQQKISDLHEKLPFASTEEKKSRLKTEIKELVEQQKIRDLHEQLPFASTEEEKSRLKTEIKELVMKFAEETLRSAVANEPDHLRRELKGTISKTLHELDIKFDRELAEVFPEVSRAEVFPEVSRSDMQVRESFRSYLVKRRIDETKSSNVFAELGRGILSKLGL